MSAKNWHQGERDFNAAWARARGNMSNDSELVSDGQPARGNRRKEESRRRLLDAARDLFVQKGYHDTRPQDIAKQAGVGHGTFYLHFADKKACFLSFVDEARDEVTAACMSRIEGVKDLEGQVRGIFDAVFDYGEANPGVFEAAVTDPGLLTSNDNEGREVNVLEQWGDVWGGIIAQHKADGAIPEDIDAELAGQAVVGMLRQSGIVARRRDFGRDRLTDALVRLLLRGLGAH